MNFFVKSEFHINTKLEIEQMSEMKFSIAPSTLPFIVSDLDYRLNHVGVKRQESFSQRRRTNLISLEKDMYGIPVIFFMGRLAVRLPYCLSQNP